MLNGKPNPLPRRRRPSALSRRMLRAGLAEGRWPYDRRSWLEIFAG